MPQARAARSFEPRANRWRPKTVLVKTSEIRTARAIVNQTPGATSIHDRGGNVTASWLIQVWGGLTVCSPASHFAAPRATPNIPSVAIKGTTRNEVMTPPFIAPINPPAKRPASTAAAGFQEDLNARAVTTLVSATLDPTDRSIPALIMIIVIPMAPVATITVCASTTRRLPSERYRSGAPLRTAKTRTTRIKPANGPSRRIKPAFRSVYS